MQTNVLTGLRKRGRRVRGHIFIGEAEKFIVSSVPDVSILLLTCQSFPSKELRGSKMIQFKQTPGQVCHIIWVNQYKWNTIKQTKHQNTGVHAPSIYREQFSIKGIPSNFQKNFYELLSNWKCTSPCVKYFLMHISYLSETVLLPALSSAAWALRTMHLHGWSRKIFPILRSRAAPPSVLQQLA